MSDAISAYLTEPTIRFGRQLEPLGSRVDLNGLLVLVPTIVPALSMMSTY